MGKITDINATINESKILLRKTFFTFIIKNNIKYYGNY